MLSDYNIYAGEQIKLRDKFDNKFMFYSLSCCFLLLLVSNYYYSTRVNNSTSALLSLNCFIPSLIFLTYK